MLLLWLYCCCCADRSKVVEEECVGVGVDCDGKKVLEWICKLAGFRT